MPCLLVVNASDLNSVVGDVKTIHHGIYMKNRTKNLNSRFGTSQQLLLITTLPLIPLSQLA